MGVMFLLFVSAKRVESLAFVNFESRQALLSTLNGCRQNKKEKTHIKVLADTNNCFRFTPELARDESIGFM